MVVRMGGELGEKNGFLAESRFNWLGWGVVGDVRWFVSFFFWALVCCETLVWRFGFGFVWIVYFMFVVIFGC